jgi:hypothetical protein
MNNRILALAALASTAFACTIPGTTTTSTSQPVDNASEPSAEAPASTTPENAPPGATDSCDEAIDAGASKIGQQYGDAARNLKRYAGKLYWANSTPGFLEDIRIVAESGGTIASIHPSYTQIANLNVTPAGIYIGHTDLVRFNHNGTGQQLIKYGWFGQTSMDSYGGFRLRSGVAIDQSDNTLDTFDPNGNVTSGLQGPFSNVMAADASTLFVAMHQEEPGKTEETSLIAVPRDLQSLQALTLVNVNNVSPSAITLDSQRAYFSTFGSKGRFVSVSKRGGSMKVIAEESGIRNIAVAGAYVYWVSGDMKLIMRRPTDNSTAAAPIFRSCGDLQTITAGTNGIYAIAQKSKNNTVWKITE